MTSSHNQISESERVSAQDALEHHRANGTLDPEHYASRLSLVSTSQTYDELDAIFSDLPLPHYERELAPRPTIAPISPAYIPTQHVMCEVIDPWDKPFGSSPITLRKIRTMGWIVAFGTMLFTFEPLSRLFPNSLSDVVFFSPLVVMGIVHVMMRPSQSKTYRRLDEEPSSPPS